MLLADKPGQKHNLYGDFAVQDYRKKAMAICYYSLTSCRKYNKKITKLENFLIIFNAQFY